jgi:cobalt-zinc-cadmium efflux system protein
MGDALGSLAAFSTAVAMKLGAPPVIDPLASFVVAGILLIGAARLLRDAARVLLEGSPPHLPAGLLRAIVRGVDGVHEVVSVHAWTLGAGHDAVVVRLRADRPDGVAARVEGALRGQARITHVWVHVEEQHAPHAAP